MKIEDLKVMISNHSTTGREERLFINHKNNE
jgi:hypothetical protein